MLDCLTNYAENAWLKHIVSETTLTPPSNWYVALFTADPGETGSLTNELSGYGYARVLHNGWAVAANRQSSNSGVVQPFSAVGGDWASATHWGLIDSPTLGSGNLWFRGEFATPVTVNNGNTFAFNNGEIAVAFDNYQMYFTSGGTYEILADDTITGDSSSATATVADITTLSGTWGTGTATGFMMLTGITDTFVAENISVGANSNCATIDGELRGAWGSYLVHKMLDLTLRGTAFAPDDPLYFGYSTANPEDDGSGVSEPSGNNYSRASNSSWTAVANGIVRNSAQINFPTPSGSWGTLTDLLVCDSVGNLYFYGKLLYSQSPGTSASVYIPVGEFVIGLERTTPWTTTTTTTSTSTTTSSSSTTTS